MGLFGANGDYLHLEIQMLPEVFFSNSNSILLGKQCDCAAA
jgi:hypothetical protein